MAVWSKEELDKAFTSAVTGEPYNVPEDIRNAATRIVRAYPIRGICDPMYIVNVLAVELGRGDGQGNFFMTVDGEKRFTNFDDAERYSDSLNSEAGDDVTYSVAFVNSDPEDYWIVEESTNDE